MRWWRVKVLAVVALAAMLLAGSSAHAAEVLVAVAANFADVVDRLAPQFQRETGHRVQRTVASTGKLYAQITNGAPFEVLLSADTATPERLEREHFAVPGTRFTYAIGGLALWSRDPKLFGHDGPGALRDGAFHHLAIANPGVAPYGVAARETMQALGVWDALQPRLVMAENIAQAHSMVASGSAELGFVALSAVYDPSKRAAGSLWEVPQRLFSPLRQDAILLTAGANSPAAQAFLEFLRSPAARRVIGAHGYQLE